MEWKCETMITEKRLTLVFALGLVSTLTLATLVCAYYNIRYEEQRRLSERYINQYKELSEKYLPLLKNYTALVKKYNKLLDNYTQLFNEYQAEKENYTQTLEEYENLTMRVNICIDYGNGTAQWYNDTLIPLGYDLLKATQLVAVVNYTYWETYQACFIDAINGVWNTDTWFWMWLKWNTENREWEYGPVSADQYILSKGETVMWRYEVPSW
jgi:hypothetical protein